MKLSIVVTFNRPVFLLLQLGLFLNPVNSVINGVASVKKDWFVQFTRDGCDQTVHCGGSLIAPDIVLTAAHCWATNNPDGLPGEKPDTAWVGRQTRPCAEPGSGGFRIGSIGKSFDFETIFYPKAYDENDPYNENDIALILLEELDASCPDRGTFSENTVLATYENTAAVANISNSMRLFGFGRIVSFADVSQVLRFGDTEYDPSQPCSSKAAGYNSAVHLCTEDAISCQGDSGGPLVYEADDKTYVVGIASYMDEDYGEYCGGTDIYTRVSNYERDINYLVCTESAYPPSDCNWPAPLAKDAAVAWIRRDLPKPSPTVRGTWSVVHNVITRAGRYFSTAGSYVWGDWLD